MKKLGTFTVNALGVRVDTPTQFLVIVSTDSPISGTIESRLSENGNDRVHFSARKIAQMAEYFQFAYGLNVAKTGAKNISIIELANQGNVNFNSNMFLTLDMLGVVPDTKQFELWAYESETMGGFLVQYGLNRILAGQKEVTHQVLDAEYIIMPETGLPSEIWLNYSNGRKVKHVAFTLEIDMLIRNEFIAIAGDAVKAGYNTCFVLQTEVTKDVRLSNIEFIGSGAEYEYLTVNRI